jgi:hypothetical protein
VFQFDGELLRLNVFESANLVEARKEERIFREKIMEKVIED